MAAEMDVTADMDDVKVVLLDLTPIVVVVMIHLREQLRDIGIIVVDVKVVA